MNEPRDVEDLLESALRVIDQAYAAGATKLLPMFSGGHDSLCSVWCASQHTGFNGEVVHIDTGIGSRATRKFVDSVCKEYGWKLWVYRSPFTYEMFVRRFGFPGPGSHQWVYNRLKDRCVRQMTKGRDRVSLLTGCRSQESVRRMGHVEPIKVGETRKNGKVTDLKRVWTSPCHDWSGEEQTAVMNWVGMPENPVKRSCLGMSGECFCGAFARPGEIDLIRSVVPDVAEEIDRLTPLALEAGTPAVWGVRPPGKKKIEVVQTGMLCSGCDLKAAAAGVVFQNC